ncbi:MAG TPA: DUF305 domain-containing protein [Polyangiales bacterium]|nr:DUF305 domain-containing protein [Polyangiales bacterium]
MTPTSSALGDRRVPFAPASDRAFIEFFVGHHEMAVHMAEHEVMHGENAEIQAMAQHMIDAQSAEIDSMKAIEAQLSDPKVTATPDDPHEAADMDHMTMLQGAELDAMFLTEMIAHHASALPVAHRSLATLRNAELKSLARGMVSMQATEIGELQAWRERLGVKGAGEDLAQGQADRADMGMTGDRRIPLTPANDADFIAFFLPHHQMAVQMAQMQMMHGASAEIRSMAERMRDAQTAEIQQMRALSKSADTAPPQDDHMHGEMKMMMQMRGSELDHMFVSEMVQHHAAGIPTAHRAKPHVQNAELRAMADNIFESQSREVGEMQHMLDMASGQAAH